MLRELLRIATSDVTQAFDPSGNLRKLQDMPEDLRRAIQSCDVITKNAEAGDGHTDRVHRIRMWDKVKALETLAKHLGLLAERIQVDGDVELSWKE